MREYDGITQLKNVASLTLDGEVFIQRADENLLRFEITRINTSGIRRHR
jgi:hypothetical protein